MPLSLRIFATSVSKTEDGRDSWIPNRRSVMTAVTIADIRNTHRLGQSAPDSANGKGVTYQLQRAII